MAAIPCMVTLGKDQHGAWNRQRRRTFVLFAAVGQQLQQAGVADSTATPQKQRRIMIGDVASGVYNQVRGIRVSFGIPDYEQGRK